MIALQAPCDALAARFYPAATLATPSGADAMRGSLGRMPKAVPGTPYVYIEVINGTVVANDRWEHEIDVDAVFLLDKRPGDPARVDKQRQLWLPSLLAATEGQLKLGIGAQSGYELAKALPTGWQWDEVAVAGDEYDAIRVHYKLFIYESVVLVP